LFWTGNVFPNWSSVFLSQNGQRGSFLVFYVGNILVDKNTLYNGCILAGQSVVQSSCIRTMVFISESSYIQTSIDHKLLEDIHEESFAKTKTNQPVSVQPSGRLRRRPDALQCPTDKH
jgi:hypothetical protein